MKGNDPGRIVFIDATRAAAILLALFVHALVAFGVSRQLSLSQFWTIRFITKTRAHLYVFGRSSLLAFTLGSVLLDLWPAHRRIPPAWGVLQTVVYLALLMSLLILIERARGWKIWYTAPALGDATIHGVSSSASTIRPQTKVQTPQQPDL